MNTQEIAVLVVFIVFLIYLRNSDKEEGLNIIEGAEGSEGEANNDNTSEPPLELKPKVVEENKQLINDVMDEKFHTADDRIFNASIVSGYKDKIAKENRSHWNNNNWKKYYDYELGIHQQSNRDWWTNDDYELSRAGHVVI